MDENSAIPGLVSEYAGIQGFYFMNTRGEFGYIAADGRAFAKEHFPELDDPEFVAQHPQFIDELHRFTHDLNVLRLRYMDAQEPDIELGYLRPMREGEFPWRTATLVLRRDVVESLYADYDTLLAQGVKDPSEASADNESLQDTRGIYHGMDDLASHQDNFGVYHYFPLLFYWPPSLRAGVRGLDPDVDAAPLRVLNLMWRPTGSGYGDDTGIGQGHQRCTTVFSLLRDKLAAHGAIDRKQRVENRFELE